MAIAMGKVQFEGVWKNATTNGAQDRESVGAHYVEKGRKYLKALTSLYEKEDIYNFDESCLFYQQQTDYSYKDKNGTKKNKVKLSIVVSTNASGSTKLPTIFIEQSKWPRCFGPKENATNDFYYRNSTKSWMTKTIFKEWICGLNEAMKTEGRGLLLLIDNASSHKVEEFQLSNIYITFLPPNTTSALQPLDAGILAAAKNAYRNELSNNIIDKFDPLIDEDDGANLLAFKRQPYK
ncbi:tigger transposable element-derived protein 6-like, partial [Thraustotheca clavata]